MKSLLEMTEEEINSLSEDEFVENLLKLSEDEQLKIFEKFPELKSLIEDPFEDFKEGMTDEEAAEFDKLMEEDLNSLEDEITDEELEEILKDDDDDFIDEGVEDVSEDTSNDMEFGLTEEELKELEE